LTVLPSSLNRLHAALSEIEIREKMKPYKVNFDFRFNMHPDPETGIQSISFFPADTQNRDAPAMKISRGEERIYVWCFFLAMMEVEDWAEIQTRHIFIDDPVSSFDDHNIFVTASTLYDLVETYLGKRKIIIATHHAGLYSILCNWLKKGEKSSKFKNKVEASILSRKHGRISLETDKSDVFLYHLRVLQLLEQARKDNDVRAYHLVLLRQVIESVSSFLGTGRIGYVLERIGFEDADKIARIMNTLAHRNVYHYESDLLVPNSLELFDEILEKLNTKYDFITHVD